MQPAGGIDDNDIVAVIVGVRKRLLHDLHRVGLSHLKNRHPGLFAHHLQLLYGRRAVDIAGHQQGAFSLLPEHIRQLCAVGGLTASLQAAHQQHGRDPGGNIDALVGAAHQLGQLVIHYLDDLLGGGQAFQHPGADALFGDIRHKLFGHAVVDVRLQQRQTHLTHGLLYVGLVQLAAVFQFFECPGQSLGQSFKCHRVSFLSVQSSSSLLASRMIFCALRSISGAPP